MFLAHFFNKPFYRVIVLAVLCGFFVSIDKTAKWDSNLQNLILDRDFGVKINQFLLSESMVISIDKFTEFQWEYVCYKESYNKDCNDKIRVLKFYPQIGYISGIDLSKNSKFFPNSNFIDSKTNNCLSRTSAVFVKNNNGFTLGDISTYSRNKE